MDLRELDCLVAEKVMGWRMTQKTATDFKGGEDYFGFTNRYKKRGDRVCREHYEKVPYYSSKISDAQRVLDKASSYQIKKFADEWHRVEIRLEYEGAKGESSSESLCLAICQAALDCIYKELNPGT